jgi:hypothetical protein
MISIREMIAQVISDLMHEGNIFVDHVESNFKDPGE